MKKPLLIVLLILFALILSGCRGNENEVADELLATQVSLILTQTALYEQITEPTATNTPEPSPTEPEELATPTFTETPTETPTITPSMDDPAQRLGNPAFTYDFPGDTSPWDFESPQTVFKTADGFLNMTARVNPNWHNWWVSSPILQNAYVEATIKMAACSGADRFGLVVRSTPDGQNFYFLAITCDGQWGFFRMSEDVQISTIAGYRADEALTPGLDDLHRVGIWMQGNSYTLYIDGVEVGTANDPELEEGGFTGFLIAFANTNGFTVQVDQLRYWNLP